MIKKLALVGLITLTLVGCTNKAVDDNNADVGQNGTGTQEQNTPDLNRDVEYFSQGENAQELIDRDINEVFDELNEPYRATYYVNSADINMININSVNKREVLDSGPVVSEFVYPRVSDKKSALYVYTDKNTITETRVGEFAQVPNNDYRDSDYRVNYNYNYKTMNVKEFDLKKSTDEFMGKNIEDFNKKYDLENSNIEVFKKGTTDKLDIYTRENSDKAILVHSKDSVIKEIKEIGDSLSKDEITKYFGK